ncbi:M14 family metallocarboxypeptidase [Salinibacillus xinjiangensis]|nr:M14 family metallocarboxypeptidase [Salinibacillus xinjiangensis]
MEVGKIRKQNKKTSRLFTWFLVFLLIFSTIPLTVEATEQLAYHNVIIKVNNPVSVNIDEQVKGEIKQGTLIFAKEMEDNYQIQWGETNFEISKEKAQIVPNKSMENSYANFNPEVIKGYFTPKKDLKLEVEKPKFHVTLSQSEKYPILEDKENVYRVVLGNRIVDVDKSVVTTIDNDTDTPNFSPNKVVKKKDIPNINKTYQSTNYGNCFKVINHEAIVYDNRGKELKEIGTLIKDQTYPIDSDYGNWHRIQFGSHYGYVHKQNTTSGNHNSINNENKTYKNSSRKFRVDEEVTVYDNTSGELVPFAELKKGQEHEIVSDYGNWYRVLIADRVGYIQKSKVTKLFVEQNNYFKVTTNNLPVYDNRTGKLVEVGTLKKDQVYPRVSDYGNWHRIQYGDHFGYVWKADTVPANGNSLKNENQNYENSSESFIASNDAVVYDNTGKKLVPFTKIRNGHRFPIVSDYGDWYRILVANRVGYIHKTSVNGYFDSKSKYFEVTTDGLTVYDNRQKGLKKIGELTKGQVYERVSDYGNWHRIQFGDHYGYVHKSGTIPNFKKQIPNYNTTYKNSDMEIIPIGDVTVYDNSSGKLEPFGVLEDGESHPVASDYGNWYRVLIANKVGYIQKNDVKRTFTKNTKYFKVNESNLPVYDNRSGSLVIVGTLTKGQTYERVSDYGNWHRIRFGNHYGYVRKSKTDPSYANAFQNSKKASYSNGTLKPKQDVVIYDNTGKELIPFATIEKGKQYPVVRDYGNWYEVNISGRYGYVSKSKVEANVMVAKEIVNPYQEYTYEELKDDIDELQKTYPHLISWEVIGKSVDGRNLYALKLGKGNTEIFINAAHHAREWLTTNLVMEMVDSYSQAYVKDGSIDGFDARNILNKTSIWFVPMVNPDGVTLVQKGPYSASKPHEVILLNNGSENFSSWKANIRGVDLNRQYPAGWDTIKYNSGEPSSMNYKGPSPLSEPESRAIYNFTLAHDFKTAVAYHSSGEILYWKYKASGELERNARRIAEMIRGNTGYSLVKPGPNPSGGGYTDWFLHGEKKPGFTPEISPPVGPRPVPLSNFNSIWYENHSVGLMLAQEAYNNRFNR